MPAVGVVTDGDSRGESSFPFGSWSLFPQQMLPSTLPGPEAGPGSMTSHLLKEGEELVSVLGR